jgi:uncharacterized protein (AIM24 family)
MANIEITNNKTNGITVWEPSYQDETLTAAGALTYVAGTVLGRVTTGGKLTHYASGALTGEEVPIAVLRNDVVFAGAGDAPIRAMVAGKVRSGDLVAHGVGALTQPELDLLKDQMIIGVATEQLTSQDNQ